MQIYFQYPFEQLPYEEILQLGLFIFKYCRYIGKEKSRDRLIKGALERHFLLSNILLSYLVGCATIVDRDGDGYSINTVTVMTEMQQDSK